MEATLEDECSICHGTTDWRTRILTRCGHKFCTTCLEDWVTSSHSFSCPMCRQNMIEANALFQRVEYCVKTVNDERYLFAMFEKVEHSPNWYHLGTLYNQRVDLSHDVRKVHGTDITLCRMKLNGINSRFVVLRQAFTPMNSLSPRPVSCADTFIDLTTLSLHRIRDDLTTEFLQSVEEDVVSNP